ncbi:MAG TPA: SpoIIE family protein phosphatase [Thermoanaerobaculia bacterium]|nr:SpoIIE family protein phosphatase [Thermoanaerobaculia bacterium]
MKRSRKVAGALWLAAFVLVVLLEQIDKVVTRLGGGLVIIDLAEVIARTALILLTLYWLAVAVRYILRKLFWRVGRRLALSYFLIGILPFLLFAVLVVAIGYAIAGVLSQTTYRTERQTFLSRMDLWNLEYAIAGQVPANALSTLQIHEVRKGEKSELPPWLLSESFTGLLIRDDDVFLSSSRIYEEGNTARTVVLLQPLDEAWGRHLEKKNGMIVTYSAARERRRAGRATEYDLGSSDESQAEPEAVDGKKPAKRRGSKNVVKIDRADGTSLQTDIDESFFGAFFERGLRPNGILWWDLSPPLFDWASGEPDQEQRVFTLIWNPWSNLLEFYFGSSDYAKGLLGVIGGIAGLLLLIYLPATLFAAVLIFSISRAVNRIEKGTTAVERGDFSYRIRMNRDNQLGQMAQSFDRMTESISTLLTTVAEKERLQSEIAIAATIQRNLLPKEGPGFRGVSFSAHFEPTASIGGDYYDVFNLDATRLAVTIGDVSGHGLSTGLVMAMVKAAITTLVEEGVDEEALFRRLNELVFRSTEKRAFMTLAFTIFDLQHGTVRHTNAGHLYPYVLRKGVEPIAIESSSLPLGVRPELLATTVEMSLHEADTLVYLSDGIIEAQDPQGEPFGFIQLEQILGRMTGESPADVQEAILAAVALHSGDRPADDDRTVMIIRFDQLASFSMTTPAEEEIVARVARDSQASRRDTGT